MAINFGGVIAGIDDEWTRQITRKEKTEDKELDRVAGVEDAMTLADYRVRLGTDESNRTERKRIQKWGEDTAGELKVLRVEPQYIKQIIGLGEGGGNRYTKLINDALEKDPKFNVNVFFKGLGVENFDSVSDNVTSVTKNMTPTTDLNNTDTDSNVQKSLFETAHGKADNIYNSASEWLTASNQKLFIATRDGDPAAIEKHTKAREIALQQLRDIETNKSTDSPRKFKFSDVRGEVTLQRQIAFGAIGVKVDAEGQIQQMIEGDAGRYAVASSVAVEGLINTNNSFKVPDPALTAQIETQKLQVKNNLDDWATTVYGADAKITGGLRTSKKEEVRPETKTTIVNNKEVTEVTVSGFEKALSNVANYKRGDVIPIYNSENVMKLYVYVGKGSWLGQGKGQNNFPFYEVGS